MVLCLATGRIALFRLHDNIVGQAALLADVTPNVPFGDQHSHAADRVFRNWRGAGPCGRVCRRASRLCTIPN